MTFTGANLTIITFIWILKFLGFMAISGCAGWFYTAQLKNNLAQRYPLSLLIGLHITPAMAVLHIHLSVQSFIITALAVTTIGYLSSQTSNTAPSRFSVPFPYHSIIIILIISALAFIAALIQLGPFSHWDHLLAPTVYVLDYARTGYPTSNWIETLNYGNWVLSQQTTAISLDAFELIWFGTFTATLSKYITLLSFITISTLITKSFRWYALILLIILSIYVIDQTIIFRPHIYVGLLLVILLLILREYPKATLTSIILCLSIVLAKRDGIIIAPLISIFLLSARLRLYALMCGIPTLLLGGIIAKIGGEPVGLLLWNALTNYSTLNSAISKLAEQNFYIPLSLTSILFFLHRNKKELLNSFYTILIVSAIIFLSAVILINGERYNFGTINRKVFYFFTPLIILFTYQCLAYYPSQKKGKHFFHIRSFASTIRNKGIAYLLNYKKNLRPHPLKNDATRIFSCCVIIFLAHNTIKTISERALDISKVHSIYANWTVAAIENIHLYRSYFPKTSQLKVGFFYENQTSFNATPFKDLDLYKFPFLQAYNGEDLKITNSINELKDRDIIFLSHEVNNEETNSYKNQTGLTLRFLYGGLKVLLSDKGLSNFNQKHIITKQNGTALSDSLTTIPLHENTLSWDKGIGIRSYYTYWNPNTFQYKLAWPTDKTLWAKPAAFTLQNPDNLYIQYISFDPHHLGDKLPASIEIETNTHTKHYKTDDISILSHYFLPIESSSPITIKLYSDQKESSFWKAPYFSIFNISAHVICKTKNCSLYHKNKKLPTSLINSGD